MKKKSREFIKNVAIIVPIIGLLWAIWSTEVSLDNTTLTKVIATLAVAIAILFVRVKDLD